MNTITVENYSPPSVADALRVPAARTPMSTPTPTTKRPAAVGGLPPRLDLYTAWDDGSALCDSKSGTHYQLIVRRSGGRAAVFHLAAGPSDLSPGEDACAAAGHGRPCRHRSDLAAVLNHDVVRCITRLLPSWTVRAAVLTTRCHCGGRTAEVSVSLLAGEPGKFRVCLEPGCLLGPAPAQIGAGR